MKGFHHLTFTDRIRIEAYLKIGKKPKEIADLIGVCERTIYREKKRGRYSHLNTDYTVEERYSPDIAQEKYLENLRSKGPNLKIGKDHKLAAYIEKRIVEDHYSPAAVLGEIKENGLCFSVTISTFTLYSYIDKGIFLRLTNKNLPIKGTRKQGYREVKRISRPPKGESIERRPEEIRRRISFGHWEMDSVVGKQKTKPSLLVLTERLTRKELVIPLPDKTASNVVRALDILERRYGQMFPRIFKTITVDNGSEFADCEGIERSRDGKSKRTTLYYCHPYSSWERGSNENQNKLVRRHFPKGTDFSTVSQERVKAAENWINQYPRKIFGWKNSATLFQEQLEQIIQRSS